MRFERYQMSQQILQRNFHFESIMVKQNRPGMWMFA